MVVFILNFLNPWEVFLEGICLQGKSKKYKIGYSVQATFSITQIKSELELLNLVGNLYFGNTHNISERGSVIYMTVKAATFGGCCSSKLC